ncbi:MAG: phospholipase [Hespellia sp.]|nr:phospholipase [Hespellia sp.]
MKMDRQKLILTVMGAIVILLSLTALFGGIQRLATGKVDTSQGMEVIREKETADIQEIERKIARLENAGNTKDTEESVEDAKDAADQEKEESQDRLPKELFGQSIVMGDSIAAGLIRYDVLNPSNVIAQSGASITEAKKQMDTVVEWNPQVLFLEFGLNDLKKENQDVEAFKEEYESFLLELQSQLPNVRVFVNGIFPVLSSAKEKEPAYALIEEYNEALQEICEEFRITYIDNEELPSERDYAEDGVHFNMDFYPVWLNQMAEVAAL